MATIVLGGDGLPPEGVGLAAQVHSVHSPLISLSLVYLVFPNDMTFRSCSMGLVSHINVI